MALNNPPRHLAELLSNVTEVGRLLSLHSATVGNGPGRKYDVEILNKSAIVLMVACWEAFVEDLATCSLEHMLRHAKSHETFPENLRERIASKNQGLNSWKLAGDGWRKVLRDNLAEVLSKTVGSLNTPKTAQVNELFEKTIGHKQLSDKWAWSGRSAKSSTTDLGKLVTLRGNIAHRIKASKNVHKSDVKKAVELISRLSAKSHNEIGTYLNKLTGVKPWAPVRYKSTS